MNTEQSYKACFLAALCLCSVPPLMSSQLCMLHHHYDSTQTRVVLGWISEREPNLGPSTTLQKQNDHMSFHNAEYKRTEPNSYKPQSAENEHIYCTSFYAVDMLIYVKFT